MIEQIIYANCTPRFDFNETKNGIIFATDKTSGYGWYNISNEILTGLSYLIKKENRGFCLIDRIKKISENASERASVESSYTYLKLKDGVFALIYQFTRRGEGRPTKAVHILIGNFPDNINITNLLSKELPCWKATQGPEVKFYDQNADRERLPALDDDSFLSVPPDSEQEKEIFDFINKNPEFYKKILCFLIEHLSNADGLNKTLLIRDTQENMILWVKVISYFLPPELKKNFTFSTNITELYEEQQSRLSDKNNNRLYFAVAGIHPEDRSCAGIAEETKMYSLADIGKGSFAYSSEYLNYSFFEDLLTGGNISSFYSGIWSKIPNNKNNVIEYYEIYSNKEKLHSLGYEKVRIILEILNKNRESYIDFEKDIVEVAKKIYDKFINLGDDVEKNLPLLFALQDYDSKFDVCDVIKKFVCSKKDGKFISYETAKKLFTGDKSVLPHIRDEKKLKKLFDDFGYKVLKDDISYLEDDLKEKFALFNVVVKYYNNFDVYIKNNLKNITKKYIKDIKQLTQLISNTPEDYKKAVYEAFAENIQQNNDAKYDWIKTSLTNEDTYKILVRIDSQTKDRQTKFDLKQAILEYQGYIVKNSDENGKEIEDFHNKIKETPYRSYLPDLKINLIAKIPGINRNLKTDFLVDYFCNYRKEAGNLTKDDKEKEDGFIRHIFSKSGEEEKENYAEKIKEAAPDKKDLLKKIFLNKQSDLIDKKDYKAVLKKIQKDKDSAEFFFDVISSKTEFYDSAGLDILNKYLEEVYIRYAKKDKKVIYPEAIQSLLRGFDNFGLEEVFKALNIFRINNVKLDKNIYAEYSNPFVIFKHCEAYSECITFFSGADENYVKKFCENLCDYVVKQPDNERLRIFHTCYEAVRNVKCGEEKGEEIFENALREKYISRIENPDENRWTKIFNGIREYLIKIDDKHSQEYVDEHLKYLNNTFRKKEAKEKLLKSLLKQIKKFK